MDKCSAVKTYYICTHPLFSGPSAGGQLCYCGTGLASIIIGKKKLTRLYEC